MKKLMVLLLTLFLTAAAGAKEITFEDALNNALSSNSEITKAAADLKIAEATVEKTYGMFDVMLDGGVTYSKSRAAVSNPLSPERTEVLNYNLSLSEKIFTGGFISLGLDSTRTGIWLPDSPYSALMQSDNPSYTPKASVSYTQPLLKGFWGRPDEKAIKVGELSTGLSKEGLKNRIANTTSSLKEAYYFVMLAAKLNEIQKKFYEDAEKFYNQTVSLKKMGLREEKDILQTEASLVSSKGELKPAENNVKFAKEMFLNLAGYDKQQWDAIEVSVTASVEEVTVPETLTPEDEEKLVLMQSEVIMAKAGLDMARTGKEISDNNNLPSLNVFGKYGIEGLDSGLSGAFDELKGGVYNNYAIGVNMKINLPDRAASGDVKNADAVLSKAQADYDFLMQMTLINLRAIYNKVKTAKEDYDLKVQARQMQEKRLKLEERDFSQGKSGTRELLMAQTDYNTAMLKEMNAFYEYAKSASAWNRVNGKYGKYFEDFIKKEK